MSKSYISNNLRQMVFNRAQGCCEYCLIPEKLVLANHQIDHVIAEKHGGATVLENLALSCSLCNQAKGSDIASIDPDSGDTVRLYNPRKDIWQEHFILNSQSGMIEPLTAIGRVTVQLLRMNRVEYLPVRKIISSLNIN
ncbi:HNH endonuclease [Sphaerospermopsis sp. FACHB-1094]|uniref:HNH endonuclease n=1 Tax=unclassified Sphaerospermopsis TaxID=2646443 RepID=UPI00164EB3E6|nr:MULTISPECIES: HNH endonuclease signature motif containing protein [unclassified Sphaerospermopsis]MBC5798265.1 HNH endonuclease [Sphaerospermopsis sp. LEGE 00249]MBD2131660.1 HNH endonuclease [Sphaerospermopsis sp. FACHB-1094]